MLSCSTVHFYYPLPGSEHIAFALFGDLIYLSPYGAVNREPQALTSAHVLAGLGLQFLFRLHHETALKKKILSAFCSAS